MPAHFPLITVFEFPPVDGISVFGQDGFDQAVGDFTGFVEIDSDNFKMFFPVNGPDSGPFGKKQFCRVNLVHNCLSVPSSRIIHKRSDTQVKRVYTS